MLLEFRRDVRRFVAGERADYPDVPVNYFAPSAEPVLDEVRRSATSGAMPAFPLVELASQVRNDWQVAARTLYANWLAAVRRTTSVGV